MNASVWDWIPSYFPGEVFCIHSIGPLISVTHGNTFELWKREPGLIDSWEALGQVSFAKEDILGAWLISDGKVAILCSDRHVR